MQAYICPVTADVSRRYCLLLYKDFEKEDNENTDDETSIDARDAIWYTNKGSRKRHSKVVSLSLC